VIGIETVSRALIVTLLAVVVVETVVEGAVHNGGGGGGGTTDAMGVVFAMTASSLHENAQVVTKQFGAQGGPSPVLIYQAVAKVSVPSGLTCIVRSVSGLPPIFHLCSRTRTRIYRPPSAARFA
jgi:hypothetical protein